MSSDNARIYFPKINNPESSSLWGAVGDDFAKGTRKTWSTKSVAIDDDTFQIQSGGSMIGEGDAQPPQSSGPNVGPPSWTQDAVLNLTPVPPTYGPGYGGVQYTHYDLLYGAIPTPAYQRSTAQMDQQSTMHRPWGAMNEDTRTIQSNCVAVSTHEQPQDLGIVLPSPLAPVPRELEARVLEIMDRLTYRCGCGDTFQTKRGLMSHSEKCRNKSLACATSGASSVNAFGGSTGGYRCPMCIVVGREWVDLVKFGDHLYHNHMWRHWDLTKGKLARRGPGIACYDPSTVQVPQA
ncbi:hypothetical protein NMY22_g3008 [Coprinellus aureogranulatus]|nr:hypothetical protein NMY22_g3008 [Coprinellus aureogranulatus]